MFESLPAKLQDDEIIFIPRKLFKVTPKTQMCAMVVAAITAEHFSKRQAVTAASAVPATCPSNLPALWGARDTQAEVYPAYSLDAASSTTGV